MAELVGGITLLLLIASTILTASKRLRLPFTILLVVAGMLVSWLAKLYPQTFALFHRLEISPDLILYVFLPTLAFESAFNLDARQLRHNLGPVLILAAPGLLLSTLIIGLIVTLAPSIPLPAALLLGAILSATDPVAVVALFKKLGVPGRLTLLVDGESLFNDATSIVTARILIGVVVAGSVTASTVAQGILDFVLVFVGGVVAGGLLGFLVGFVLGKVESDPSIEITLTTILAYVSFILAEEVLHVSGVMATVGAGLTLGGWGRMKVSPSVRTYLEHFWEYIAFVANALIFLLVGLRMDLGALWATRDLLALVILAMLVSRAVVVYGLMPLVGRIPGGEPVDLRYQTVIFWGGLRGAIALAIVLSLPPFGQTETFIVLVMGAVLFTLLAQGLTIEVLVRWLGLNRPPLADRFAHVEGQLAAKQRAQARIPELLAGGLFSGAIAERLQQEYETEVGQIRATIQELRRTELDRDRERQLLYLLGFAEEKSLFIDMFNKGHLSERAFRELMLILTLQVDAVRHDGVPDDEHAPRLRRRRLEQNLARILDRIPGLAPFAEQLRMARIAMDYEEAWGRYQGSGRVLDRLDNLAQLNSISVEVVEEVRHEYRQWHEMAQRQLDETAEQFPEFVNVMQEWLGRRLMLLAEAEVVEEHAEHGTLPHGVAEDMQTEIVQDLRTLRGYEASRLRVGPTELLRRVPFFRDIPPEEFAAIATRMRSYTATAEEVIIRQGEAGESLFLIARGVVRVAREEHGATRDLATLIAGDFFGEMALLHREPRSATVRAVTPCSLYELRRADLDLAMEAHPGIRRALTEADRKRKAEIGGR